MKRFLLGICIAVGLLSTGFCQGSESSPGQNKLAIDPDLKAALERISDSSLRTNLSIIANDSLEGRATPSRGLEIAARYIAEQFRIAGIEPAGDDGYFQTANWVITDRPMENFVLKVTNGPSSISVTKDQVSFTYDGQLDIANAGSVKIDFRDSAGLAGLTQEIIGGRVVVTEIPDFTREDRSKRQEMFLARSRFLRLMTSLKAAAVVSLDRISTIGTGSAPGRLIDPENRPRAASQSALALITVHNPEVVKLFDGLANGSTTTTLTITIPAQIEKPVKLHNVVGLLKGSDPKLRDTYVLVTAHYDHLGMRGTGAGDHIYNGANDDGSGTVSVIELAKALGGMKHHPKRSILFMTVFGEERGLLGSRYYGRHPIFPIEKTVADMNLEQVGRTDSDDGPQIRTASVTGFDFSDLPETFRIAGESLGIKVYKHERNSDAYFGASDNQALADLGVPAHTLCVAYSYPDYHGLGDEWQKVDYENMRDIDRMVALALFTTADNLVEPHWNASNPKAARYLKAWEDLRKH